MQNRGCKKAHLFFSSFFIFLLHLPVAFAKIKHQAAPDAPSPEIVKVPHSTSSISKNEPGIHAISNSLYDSLKLGAIGLSKQVFDYALTGFEYLKKNGRIANQDIISIADFSKSSTKKRLFVIDLKNVKVLFNTYVAHGMNSGQEFAKYFSNVPQSNMSSLGFYETSNTYQGKNGYSMHLKGLEKGINDKAFDRDIVMHGAPYVSETLIQAQGFLGRSQGCPAVPQKQHRQIIDKIKNGTCLFIFSDNSNYFRRSAIIKNNMPLLA